MAKSVRASVSKRNKAKLRATVFGPVVDARTERLSAKLQELASQPKPKQQEKEGMELDVAGSDGQNETAEAKNSESNETMDVDRNSAQSSKSRSGKSGRIQKRRNKNSIVFQKPQSKSRKGSKRK